MKRLEKAMRRVEVKKLWQVGNASITVDDIMRLTHAFMDITMQSEDYRYLNAALKLNDRLREEFKEIVELAEIEQKEKECLLTVKKRLGLLR